MKTLTIGETFGFRGGLEQYCFQVANALSTLGHSHVLLHEQSSGISEDTYRSTFEDVVQIPASGGESDYAAFLDKICEQHQPDVALVHKSRNLEFMRALRDRLPTITIIQDHHLYCLREVRYFPKSRKICTLPLGSKCMLYGCFLGRPLHCKVVPTLHTLGPRKKLLAAHRNCHGVIVLSNYMKDQLVLNGFAPEKIDVVHGFTVPPETPPAPMPPKNGKILFVGQIIRSKGLDVLLRAIALLPKAHLVAAGAGSALEANRALAAELGITDRVEFTGMLSHAELEKYYAQTAVQVVPSVWAEPFGLVGLEAMVRRRPVVAFDVGGVSDWLDDGRTGILAKEITPKALAEAIGKLLDDHDLAEKMGQAGHRSVLQDFMPGVAAKTIEASIVKILRGTAEKTKTE